MKKYITPAVMLSEFYGKDIVTGSGDETGFEFDPNPGFGDVTDF